LKNWIHKFVDQLNLTQPIKHNDPHAEYEVSEELATLLYILDAYGKNLIETDNSPIRQVREALDEYSKDLLQHHDENFEKTCFRLRQFFSSHRNEEYAFVQKNFDEFRKIIWEFVDHLSEEMLAEQREDLHFTENIEKLREAVESNSIEQLKSQSKDFINSYVKVQTKKEERKANRITKVKKNLSSVKKQLVDANNSLKLDHLTKAFNRRSFDEQIKQHWNMHQITNQPVSLIMLDIDYFKRVNDTFGHAIGDLVLM
jgi:diguanylate cyclase